MGRSIGTVERAFQVASEVETLEEVRRQLKREGFAQVEEHLSGGTIQSDLKKLLKPAHSTLGLSTSNT